MAYIFALRQPDQTRFRPLLMGMRDDEIQQTTRLTRDAVDELCELLRVDLERQTRRHNALTVENQVLCGLQFLGSGSFQWMVGRSCGLSQPSASRAVTIVTETLCKRASDYIRFPTNPTELNGIKQSFHAMAGFPNTIGCIDGTHIAIKAPKDHEEAYVNRKGVHTINVQAVCDADMRIIDVVAKWPGSSHDSFIWKNSSLHTLMEHGYNRDGWLLGDSGYPLEPWLMTPVANPMTPSEQAYNLSHAKTRNIVERCFGVLKSRFRCLDKSGGTLLYKPEKACKIFVASAVLHNFCISHSLDVLPDPDIVARNAALQPTTVTAAPGTLHTAAVDLRRRLIQQF